MPGDCCECGACCFSESDTYVLVSEEDRALLGSTIQDAVIEVEGAYFLRMDQGRCAQLEYAEGAWVCGIYRKRPTACRALKRGSPPCLAERALKRLKVRKAAKTYLD